MTTSARPVDSDRFASNRLIWAAALLMVLATIGIVVHGIGTRGVYWSRVQAHFLIPQSSASPNGLVTVSGPLVNVAGLVGRLVDPSTAAVDVSSQKITLADEGIRHGYSVTLPNSGGQYSTIFNTPALDVQAVGTSAGEVVSRMRNLTKRIQSTLNRLQVESKVRVVDRITVQITPPVAPTFFQKGSSTRAVAAVALLEFGLAVAVFKTVSRSRRRVASL